MDFDKVSQDVQRIVAITESVPEVLRERCFEILLNHVLQETLQTWQQAQTNPDMNTEVAPLDVATNAIPINAQLRVFMRRYELTDSLLGEVLIVEEDKVHFIKEPTHNVIKRGQKEWALLLSLSNAITSNQFFVDVEQLRSVCEDKGYYDPTNFAGNLKDADVAILFKGPLVRGGSQNLSSDGEAALATLIKTFVA